MIDLIWIIKSKVFRIKEMPIAWEELSEKQTTKLWYFLLFCMFFAIITSAQWTLSIIKDIPDKPTMIPYCVSDIGFKFWK